MKKTFLEKQIKEHKVKTTDENFTSPFQHSIIISKEQINDRKVLRKGGVVENQLQWLITVKVYSSITYENLVVGLIREKYNADDEYAILRKKLANLDENNEFDEYSQFVESCKIKAKAFIYERDSL